MTISAINRIDKMCWSGQFYECVMANFQTHIISISIIIISLAPQSLWKPVNWKDLRPDKLSSRGKYKIINDLVCELLSKSRNPRSSNYWPITFDQHCFQKTLLLTFKLLWLLRFRRTAKSLYRHYCHIDMKNVTKPIINSRNSKALQPINFPTSSNWKTIQLLFAVSLTYKRISNFSCRDTVENFISSWKIHKDLNYTLLN